MIHNESVNIWSHLVGAGFIVVLVAYTAFFLSQHKDALLNFNADRLKKEIKSLASPILDEMPNFSNIT